MNCKQVIVVRNDLPWKKFPGKLAAQVAHAAQQFLLQGKEKTLEERGWQRDEESAQAIIVCKVADEAELRAIATQARDQGLTVHEMVDAGRTVFPEPTLTCIAIGPHKVERFGVTSHLSLLY